MTTKAEAPTGRDRKDFLKMARRGDSEKVDGTGRSVSQTVPQLSARAWGIELSTRSVRGLLVGLDAKRGTLHALAADVIRYQPPTRSGPWGDDPVGEALSRFVERNAVGDALLAVGVPDPTALILYREIPAIDEKRLGDLVAYEAKVQIPRPLNEVIWDYQRFEQAHQIGNELQGDLLCLVALNAVRVHEILAPFDALEVPVDVVQLSPLAIANFACHERCAPEEGILAMIDLRSKSSVITLLDEPRIWRSRLATGGDAFTAELAENSSLTIQQAEILKCNSARTLDPQAFADAMTRSYAALITEVARTIGDRLATGRAGRALMLGNGFALPGLVEALAATLPVPVARLDRFAGLDVSGLDERVISRVGLSTLGACYGLALGALGIGPYELNLLPGATRPDRSQGGSGIFSWFSKSKKG